MKIYMLILDGAADRKIPELSNKTPLEFAKTDALSYLVSRGSQCMIDVIGDEIIPESDSGAMALLSYSPQKYYPGRGTLEGLGTGCIPNNYNYAAFRVNFASYNKETGFLDRRTSRGLSDHELQSLCYDINTKVNLNDFGVKFNLIAFGHHRGILCIYSKNKLLSGNVSNTDPGFRKVGMWGIPVKNYFNVPNKCEALDNTAEAIFTSQIINEFEKQAYNILQNHSINISRISKGKLPANYLLIRDGGNPPKEMPKFKDLYNKSLVMFGQLPAEKAIADLIGESFIYSKSLDLQLDKSFLTNMANRITSSTEDVIFIHIKGPDEPGHDNEPMNKVKAIEMIDQFFVKPFIEKISDEDVVIVTCDHATPCELKIHSNDKVPLLISGGNIMIDSTISFNETEAYKGKLNITQGIDILPFVMNLKGGVI